MLIEEGFKPEKISEELKEPKWLQELRNKCYKKFKNSSKPNFKYGLSIKVDISELVLDDLNPLDSEQSVSLPEEEDVVVCSLHKALQEEEYEEIIKENLFSLFDESQHKLSSLHGSFWSNGLFIYIPENTKLDNPLHLYRHSNGSNIHHTLVVIEDDCDVEIIEHLSSDNSEQSFISDGFELISGDRTNVEVTTVQDYDLNSYYFNYRKVSCGGESSIETRDFCFGGGFVHSNIANILDGEGSDSLIYGGFFGIEEQQLDLGVSTIHKARHTTSDILGKGVLDDSSKNIYRGLVDIEENASDCKGYQTQDALLLSQDSEADNIPKLEIENNEVDCGHAATASHLDEEKMFYMKTRGIDEEESHRLLVNGFLNPIVDRVNDDKTRDEINKIISERIKKNKS